MNKPKVVSIFTGAGGMDEGFKAAGFEVVASMDIERWACDTLRENNPNQIIVGPPDYSGNIKQINAESFSKIIGYGPGEIDVLVGGPPCQPFSQAASQRFLSGDDRFKRKGFKDDEKGTLLFDFIDYIIWFKPKVFVIENVPGLLTIDDGKQLNASLQRLEDVGYKFTLPRTVNAAEYGVPQFRERLIIWGALNLEDLPQVPNPTHTNNIFGSKYNCVAQALAGTPIECFNHVTRDHKPESVARYQKLTFGQREKKGRVDRLNPYAPSKTVIAGGMKGGGRSHLHPFLARTLSVRECARLQTFRDDFKFTGSIARQFTQVGNAVPPLLAEHFARQIMKDVFGNEITGPFVHEQHISKSPTDLLVQSILENARKQKMEWLYKTEQ